MNINIKNKCIIECVTTTQLCVNVSIKIPDNDLKADYLVSTSFSWLEAYTLRDFIARPRKNYNSNTAAAFLLYFTLILLRLKKNFSLTMERLRGL